MKLNKFQKAKVAMALSFFGLLFAILFIPKGINHGLSWISEDTMETIFLFLSYLAAIYVFWHYDYVVQKREQESHQLSSKLQSKEKELIETFQYLGKINVRFSVIRDFLERMKQPAPTSEKELGESLEELLDIVCNATGREKVWLKIVDIKSKKILIEKFVGHSSRDKKDKHHIAVGNLLDVYENKISSRIKDFEIFHSKADNFNLKAFLILPFNEEMKNQSDDFLKAIANQCEILFLLFDFQRRV